MAADKAREPAQAAPPSAKAPSSQANVIAAGCRVIGNLTISGSLRLGGEVVGDVHCDGALIVETGASIKGRTRAGDILVMGSLIGEIVAVRKIDVMTGARVEGSIFAPSMKVEGNACVDGDLLISPERSPAHAERAKTLSILAPARSEPPASTAV
ncbi:putative lipoprotein [Hyphomonas neptunium ATCC 15444]|uniref:Putative lipoprotein n=2 Tax=Hyphomonas TaxID=85 RepID=Q0C519_HYPNA|nr:MULTISPECIES: polymer-forming cytoskeletal protein [Hyphomonas]ABI76590.1 putative lipoprotein [Hyphomonas neptunium ATCC 15444]KCZ95607.1 putative lipoprotein [Hyphomonas hirschiana VP5]